MGVQILENLLATPILLTDAYGGQVLAIIEDAAIIMLIKAIAKLSMAVHGNGIPARISSAGTGILQMQLPALTILPA